MLILALLLGCPAPEPPPEPPPQAQPEAVVEVLPQLPEPTEARYAASHVLITWEGAVRARAGIHRDEAQARILAQELHQRAEAGESLEQLAISYSDGPSAPRGGVLGVYATGTMVPEFERAVASVEPGQLAPLTRSPFGWHVIRRDPVEEIRVSHLLVAWDGSLRSATRRSKDEAHQRATEALTRLQAGEDFAALASELSDDSTRMVGGDLGLLARGQMVPAFEDAAFALEPGQHSELVETPYGFHLVMRTE